MHMFLSTFPSATGVRTGVPIALRRVTKPARLSMCHNVSAVLFRVQFFSRGIPYTPEGTIQDFTSSPRHVGIERLFQEKDEAILGRKRPGANYTGPVVTTRDGSRPLFPSSQGSAFSEAEPPMARWSPTPPRDNGGDVERATRNDDFPLPPPHRHSDHHHHHGHRHPQQMSPPPSPSSSAMQQFFSASVASSGDSYRPDCRTDPQYAHLPDHMRSAQQSILDMQHDSYGESIRGMVPPPPPVDPFEAPTAYTPPRVTVPTVWYVVVIGFLSIFALMGTYGR